MGNLELHPVKCVQLDGVRLEGRQLDILSDRSNTSNVGYLHKCCRSKVKTKFINIVWFYLTTENNFATQNELTKIHARLDIFIGVRNFPSNLLKWFTSLMRRLWIGRKLDSQHKMQLITRSDLVNINEVYFNVINVTNLTFYENRVRVCLSGRNS